MYEQIIEAVSRRPAAFAPTSHAFWDDPYIAGQMLRAHLDKKTDAASRNHAFVRASARWIASLVPSGGAVLDLGCGPGLYAELFCDAGLQVTGMDISETSLAYAERSAGEKGKPIAYARQNYLSLRAQGAFDLVALIYCDFCVLPPGDRKRLLKKVHRALRPGGLFVFDAHTENAYRDFLEKQTVSYENGGFWSPERYVLLKRDARYGPSVVLEQYTVITAKEVRTYNIWNEAMDENDLRAALHAAGFSDVSFYADVCGRPRGEEDLTICAVAKK